MSPRCSEADSNRGPALCPCAPAAGSRRRFHGPEDLARVVLVEPLHAAEQPCSEISGQRAHEYNHHAANRFAGMHQIESLFDVIERHFVGDEIIDVDLASYTSRRSAATPCVRAPAECSPLQTRRSQLKRPSADFLPDRPRAMTDTPSRDGSIPAPDASASRCRHIRTIIRAAAGECTRCATNSPSTSFGFTKWVKPNSRPGLCADSIHADDFVGATMRAPWTTLRPIAPNPTPHIGSRLYFGCVGHGANAVALRRPM